LLWVWTLWRGERSVFQESMQSCVWDSWEKWVSSHAMISTRDLC
jgi:hypothetical protein